MVMVESSVRAARRESSEGKKFDKLRLCGDFFFSQPFASFSLSLSLSLFLFLSVNRPVDICHENRSACRQTVRPLRVESRENIFRLVDRCFPKSWADKEQQQQCERRENQKKKKKKKNREKRERKKKQNGKKKNMRTPTRFFGGCKKHVFARGEPRLGPDQMATGLICMRPLPPGVPEFAYERVALTDFSPSCPPSSFLSLSLFSSLVPLPLTLHLYLPLSFSLARFPRSLYGAVFNPRCTHLWVTSSARRVVNSPLNFR